MGRPTKNSRAAKARQLYRMYLRRASVSQWLHLGKSALMRLSPKMGNRFPISVLLGVTDQCQCRCAHCGVSKEQVSPHEVLTLDEIQRLAAQLRSVFVTNVTLTGGEPLLRDDIFDIVASLRNLGLVVSLDTNGLLVDLDRVHRLRRAGLNLMKISLDAASRDVHDAFRGVEGCFDKAVNGLKLAAKAGLPTVVQTCLSPRIIQQDQLGQIAHVARRSGALGVIVQIAKPVGRWAEQSFSNEKTIRYLEANLDGDFIHYANITSKKFVCTAVLGREAYISSRGDVQPCLFVPLRWGNIREDCFRAIWSARAGHPFYGLDGAGCPLNDSVAKEKIGLGQKPKSDNSPPGV